MSYENYSRIRVKTDRLGHEGIRSGDIGYIIEVYEDGNYEVEFSDENGVTILLTVLAEYEFELADEMHDP